MKTLLTFLSIAGFLLCAPYSFVQAQNFGWAKRMNGSQYDNYEDIAIDKLGNVYTLGDFEGTRDFTPENYTEYLLTSEGNNTDIFVSKMNAEGNFVWAKRIGNKEQSSSHSMDLDADGNVYFLGVFRDSLDCDPGPGVYYLAGGGIFIIKLDPSGNFVWAKKSGSGGFGLSLAVDRSGSCYTTGWISGKGDFDPGPGTYFLEPNLPYFGASPCFISKLDSAGNFAWAKLFWSKNPLSGSMGRAITLDDSGNAYIAGSFSDIIDIDPGPGKYELASDSGRSTFICKLNTSGNFVWAKKMGGANAESEGLTIQYNGMGCIYATGIFNGTVDFDPGPDTSMLTTSLGWGGIQREMFILKLDTAGNFVWAKKMPAQGIYGGVMDIDASGDLYVSTRFFGLGDFDPGPATYYLRSDATQSSAYLDVSLSKLDANGNFIWAKKFDGPYDEGYSGILMAFNRWNDGVYIFGEFEVTADFDPGPKVYPLNGSGIFISKTQCKNTFDSTIKSCYPVILNGDTFNTSGVFTHTKVVTNMYGCDSTVKVGLRLELFNLGVSQSGDTLIADMKADDYRWINCANDSVIAGAYSRKFVPPFSGQFKVVLIQYYMQCVDSSVCYTAVKTSTGIELHKEKTINVFPNPNNGHFTLRVENMEPGYQCLIINSMGRQIAQYSPGTTPEYECNLDIPDGLYFIQVVDGSGIAVLQKKFVVSASD